MISQKKNALLLIFFILISALQPITAQTGTDSLLAVDTISEDKIFEKVEVEAFYPPGEAAWLSFLVQNLNGTVPANNGAPAGIYTVVIQFVVDKTGKIADIKALTNHGYGMEAEVIRLLRKSPRWSPAVQDGRNVKAYRKQPVTFQVAEDKKQRRRDRS
jgi:periplasmic protein TonB